MKDAILETLDYSQKLIISPDIDGFSCAKMLADYNDSQVVGLYDKNILVLAEHINPIECLFVDCDMNAPFVSIGNHMRLSDDNMSIISFNPNTYYDVKQYTSKFPYATAFLIAHALEVETTHTTKIRMSYADSTYKNAKKYESNMRAWSEKMWDENVKFVLDEHNYLDIDRLSLEYPKQAFVSRRVNPQTYIDKISEELSNWAIPSLPLVNYQKFDTGLVDKTTVKRYMDDIISYAEIYTNEFSVTYRK